MKYRCNLIMLEAGVATGAGAPQAVLCAAGQSGAWLGGRTLCLLWLVATP